MFLSAPGKPSRLKQAVYLLASTILGLLLSFLLHAFLETNYLFLAESRGWQLSFYGGCALPPLVQITLWLLGAVGGFFLGRFWWRKVYIERVWAKKIS